MTLTLMVFGFLIDNAVGGCCETLQNFDGVLGWHQNSKYLSGKHGRPPTGYGMSYGDSTICAASKSKIWFDRGGSGCSGAVTWPEANDFCDSQGARLCTRAELIADETHGSGCNYDYRQIWSSDKCNSCPNANNSTAEGLLSYQVEFGYSAVSDLGGSGHECRAATKLAYTRCCADACDPATTRAEYALATQTTTTTGCPALEDTMGSWPATSFFSSPRTINCPGYGNGVLTRRCLYYGWEDTSSVVENCVAPQNACDVCECYNCGGNTGRVCGSAVGTQTDGRGVEFFVDCAHKNLIRSPQWFPSNTSRIDMQGNSEMKQFHPNCFQGATSVWRIYIQGLLKLTSFPTGLFNDLTALEIFDSSDVAVTSLSSSLNTLTSLQTAIFYFYTGLTYWPGLQFAATSSLTTLTIGACANVFTISHELLSGRYNRDITSFLLLGLPQVVSLPATLLQGHTFGKVDISFMKALTTLPRNIFATTITDEIALRNVQGGISKLSSGTFSSVGDVKRVIVQLSPIVFAELGDDVFDGIDNIDTLDIIGYDVTKATKDTFKGLGKLKKLTLTGIDPSRNGISNFSTGDIFGHMPEIEEIDIKFLKISHLPPKLLSVSTLKTCSLRCVVGLKVFPRGVVDKNNEQLTTISITDMPDMSEIEPLSFHGVPLLNSIEISGNRALRILGTNTFDGAFSSTEFQPRISLASSYFEVVSKRAFNFDSFGINNDVVIDMSSANDAVGLANCNGYLWMTTDPHFVLAGLKCKTRVSKTELLSFDMSDCDTCCLTQADSQTVVALRASAANENITSWDLLSVSLREGVNKYCDVADWTVDSTSGTFERRCGVSCATDTSDKSIVFGTMPLPIFENFPKTSAFGTSQAYTCASPVIYECPIGFRREIGSALQMLDCEPWQHDTAPSYETQHFVGEYHCFGCGVIDCATCDVDARKCQECNPGLFLHDDADDGPLCVSKCADGFEASTIDTGLSTGKVSNCVAASTVDTALALALGVTFGVVLIIGVVAFVAYSRRKKRKSKKLKAHIQVQASKIEELEEFKKQVDGLKQVYDIWPPQSARHSLIEASSGGTFEFSNHGTNSSVTEETNSATDSVGWFAVVSTNNTWCLAKRQGLLLSFSVPSLTTPVAMLNPEMMEMVESAFQSHRTSGDSIGTFQRNQKPIAPQPAKGYNSEWYWKEDLVRVSAHDPSTVFKPHWIRYAGSVQMELESRYWAWKTGNGPNEHSTDLQDRISSTGTESKAFGTDTGTSYKVFFDSSQQQNQKSGFVIFLTHQLPSDVECIMLLFCL